MIGHRFGFRSSTLREAGGKGLFSAESHCLLATVRVPISLRGQSRRKRVCDRNDHFSRHNSAAESDVSEILRV